MRTEDSSALARSLSLSMVNIVYQSVKLLFAVGSCYNLPGYLKQLMKVGSGLPLVAIREDKVGEELDLSEREINDVSSKIACSGFGTKHNVNHA